MGLLSDPESSGGRWTRALLRWERGACALAWLAALVWLLALAHSQLNNATYFSENALLPGLVRSDFTDDRAAKRFYTEYLEELEDKYSQRDEMPVPWLVGKMSQLHLEVHTHNFTLHYPLGRGQVFKGTNVYGILRAPRTSSLEALVVSVPYRAPSSHQKGTAAGVALMLAFAQFARPQLYWAKDIIFLVTEHEQLGAQAWLEAYHGDVSPERRSLDAGRLRGRSGAIQAAINLEFHAPNIKYVEVKVEGLNGQLPNLDLVNLVHKMCLKSSLHHSYKNSYSWVSHRSERSKWTGSLWTLLGQISTQFAGVPNGNHGLFHRYGIEAVTLEGRGADDPAAPHPPPRVASLAAANFHRLGTALEGTLRSLNNLLERFHQSYFFYLLLATDRFVSIGQYMPSLCLLCGALLVRALALRVSQQPSPEETEPAPAPAPGGKKKGKRRRSSAAAAERDGDEPQREGRGLLGVGASYLLVHLAGYAVMTSPLHFSHIGAEYWGLRSEQSVYLGLSVASLALALLAPPLSRSLGALGGDGGAEQQLAAALLELATACLAVGMHNFSLGLTLAAVYTPLALLVTAAPPCGKLGMWCHRLKQALCLALHPLCLLTLALMLYSRLLFPEEPLLAALARGLDAARQAVMFAVVDSMIYGNWLFNVVCVVVLPVWTIFWQTLCAAAAVPAPAPAPAAAPAVAPVATPEATSKVASTAVPVVAPAAGPADEPAADKAAALTAASIAISVAVPKVASIVEPVAAPAARPVAAPTEASPQTRASNQ